MSKNPHDLTEAELAAMSPHDRAWYERISAQVARDEAEAANEVPVVFSREQALFVLALADDYTGPLGSWADDVRDLVTDALRAKGME